MQAAERYVRGQLSMGLASREDACADQMQHLHDLIRARIVLTQDECSELFSYLHADNGTFSFDDRQLIAKLAQTRCKSGENRSIAVDDDNQDNPFLHLYYPDWLWGVGDDFLNGSDLPCRCREQRNLSFAPQRHIGAIFATSSDEK